MTKSYDAIVVGSGATGGIAAKELTERGLDVLVLEAGPAHDEALFHQHTRVGPATNIDRFKAALKGQHLQARAAWFHPDKSFLFVNDRDSPYTTDADPFLWVRGHQVGGRFLSWGRVAVRMSDYDFKAFSMDGYGEDWPISYEELIPYYEQVEEFLGIVGAPAGIENLPDGKFVREAGLSKLEKAFQVKVEKSYEAAKVTPWRYVVSEATPVNDDGKRTTSPLAAAQKSGRMTLRTNAVVARVNIDSATSKANGVTFIDRDTCESHNALANIVVLCASTIETVRLLLNSGGGSHSNGLGNSSDNLGKYFMDQSPSLVFGSVPGSRGFELVDGENPADNHGGFYIPRFQNMKGNKQDGFARGFNIQGMAGRIPVPDDVPALFGLTAQGEMLARRENCIGVNRGKTDAWGIPTPNVHITLTENERNMLKSQMDTTMSMVEDNGWKPEIAASVLGIANNDNLMPNDTWFDRMLFRMTFKKTMGLGGAIHECGGARMGTSPKASVLNRYNQCWDVSNVFVTDASCFVSNSTVGPTLTTMALTARACEYIANEYNGSPDIPLA